MAQLEKKIRHKDKKSFTLKETIKIARALGEDEDFYALVWFQEEARKAGLDAGKYIKDLR